MQMTRSPAGILIRPVPRLADAFSKGNESYTDALARQKQLTSGWQLPSLPKLPGGIFLIIGVIVVVLAVVGVIIYRKRSRWTSSVNLFNISFSFSL